MFDSLFVKEDVTLCNLYNIPTDTHFLAKLFSILGNLDICVDMICRSSDFSDSTVISFTADDDDIDSLLKAMKILNAQFPAVRYSFSLGNSKLSLKGSDMPYACDVCGKVFSIFEKINADILCITTDYDEISVLLHDYDCKKALLEFESNR